MELFNGQTQTLLPGQRLIKVKGYEGANKYADSMPRDCEAIFLDSDEDTGYIAKTDTNGGVQIIMFDMVVKEPPVFKPELYVTKNDFESFKEEMLNGFNDLKYALASGNTGSNKRYNGNKQPNQPNTELSQSPAAVQ